MGGGTRGAAVGGPQARGVVNRPQTVTEWAEAVVDTAQIDVADRTGPAGVVDDARATAPTLRVSAGAGRVELLVGGWLDGPSTLFNPTSAVRHVWRASLLREAVLPQKFCRTWTRVVARRGKKRRRCLLMAGTATLARGTKGSGNPVRVTAPR